MTCNGLASSLRQAFGLIASAGLLYAWSATAEAQSGPPIGESRVRLAIAGGIGTWPDAADLEVAGPGKFDAGSFVIDFAAHWKIRERGTDILRFGLNVGGFSSESNIVHRGKDVLASGFYLEPSVMWELKHTPRRRVHFDAGLGYYDVDISEVPNFYSGGWNDSWNQTKLWQDSGIGGFVGVTVDFKDDERPSKGAFTMGAKVHFFDSGTVHDRDPVNNGIALGPNAGHLGGPLVAMQFGYVF